MIDLSGHNLSDMNMRGIDLSHADLRKADLRGTDLSYASLYEADLTGAKTDAETNFYHADLRGTVGTPFVPMRCPSDGPFIGWKIANSNSGDPVVVKLLIPADARRASGTVEHCRCSKAYVLELEGGWKEAFSRNDPEFRYIKGEYVYPDRFDADRWDNWGHGIYFFVEREAAIRWMRRGR